MLGKLKKLLLGEQTYAHREQLKTHMYIYLENYLQGAHKPEYREYQEVYERCGGGYNKGLNTNKKLLLGYEITGETSLKDLEVTLYRNFPNTGDPSPEYQEFIDYVITDIYEGKKLLGELDNYIKGREELQEYIEQALGGELTQETKLGVWSYCTHHKIHDKGDNRVHDVIQLYGDGERITG